MEKTTVLGALTAALIVLAAAVNVQAATIWLPTDSGEIDVQYFDYFAPHQFAIFDDSSALLPGDPHLVLDSTAQPVGPLAVSADTIDFTQNGADWILTSSTTGNTLTLTNSNHFQLALYDGINWTGDIGYLEVSYGQYVIEWPKNITLLQIDAVPVPIPAGIYLLGVGLLACAGLRKHTHGSDKEV